MEAREISSMGMLDRRKAEQASKYWWLLLVNGIISVLAGILILSIPWTLTTLAIFVGAFLILRGIFQAFSPPHTGSSRAWNITIGVVTAVVGLAILAFPAFAGFTLLVLATFIGVLILLWGVVTAVGSVTNRDAMSYWWLSLIAGIVAAGLGIVALFEPILTLAIAMLVVGVWAIVAGISELVLAYEVRRLPVIVDELERARQGMVSMSAADEIERMAELRNTGIVTEEEFERFKARRIA